MKILWLYVPIDKNKKVLKVWKIHKLWKTECYYLNYLKIWIASKTFVITYTHKYDTFNVHKGKIHCLRIKLHTWQYWYVSSIDTGFHIDWRSYDTVTDIDYFMRYKNWFLLPTYWTKDREVEERDERFIYLRWTGEGYFHGFSSAASTSHSWNCLDGLIKLI